MEYTVPGGKLGDVVAKFFGDDPGHQLMQALRAAKQIIETGAVVVSESSLFSHHPGQPPSDDEYRKYVVARQHGLEYPSAGEQA
jgi:hypothetical protein